MDPELRLDFILRLKVLNIYRMEVQTLLAQRRDELKKGYEEFRKEEPNAPPFNPMVVNELQVYQRYAFIAMLVSVVEVAAEEYCRVLTERKKLVPEKRYDRVKETWTRRAILQKCKRFLSSELSGREWASVEKLWEQLNLLSLLRNCILHAGGFVSSVREKDRNRVVNFAKNNADVFTIQADKICLTWEGCEEASKRAKSVLIDLANVMPPKG